MHGPVSRHDACFTAILALLFATPDVADQSATALARHADVPTVQERLVRRPVRGFLVAYFVMLVSILVILMSLLMLVPKPVARIG